MEKVSESLPSLLSAFVALALGLSITYDWTYFAATDTSFFEAMSLVDHLVSGMTVLPAIIFYLFVARVIDFEGMGLKWSTVRNVDNSAEAKKSRFKKNSIGVFSALLLASMAFLIAGYFLSLMAFSAFWFLRSVSYRIQYTDWETQPSTGMIIQRLLFVWIFTAWIGYYMGLTERNSSPIHQLKMTSAGELLHTKILRFNEQSLLTYHNGAFHLIPRSSIEEVTVMDKRESKDMPAHCWLAKDNTECLVYWDKPNKN